VNFSVSNLASWAGATLSSDAVAHVRTKLAESWWVAPSCLAVSDNQRLPQPGVNRPRDCLQLCSTALDVEDVSLSLSHVKQHL
jgi:hypothetical protein